MISSLRFSLCVGALGVLGLSLASASILNAKPAGKVDIRGEITRVTAADDVARARGMLGTILVEGAKQEDTNHDSAVVRVTKDTKIEFAGGKAGTFDDLQKGMKVECEFTGVIAKSLPPQATAVSVVILKK